MFCWNCGKEIPEGSKFCPECGASIAGGGNAAVAPGQSGTADPSTLIMFNKKSEILALILSLILPGLGHLYIGQAKRGAWLLIGAIVFAIAGLFLFVLLIAYLILWIYAMYDAYNLAKLYNRHLLEHNGQPPW